MRTMRTWMRSTITTEAVIYEVLVDEVLVWRRLVEIRTRNANERRAVAREQEHVAFRLAASPSPMDEAKNLRGPGPVSRLGAL